MGFCPGGLRDTAYATMSNTAVGVVDFLVIAPLKEERDAVLAHLGNARRLPPDEQDVRIYYQADVATQLAGGTAGSYRVIVTSPLGMGRVEASTATADAIRRWQPRYVLLVGIAGGDPDEVELGDVLIAEQFVDYELAKLTDEGSKLRYQTFRVDPRLYGAAQNLSGWEASVKEARPEAGKPHMHLGIVISGDKLQAATDALKPYKADWPKLIGVEMEATGVAAAAWEAVNKPGVLMVRGVSDLADAKKGSGRVKKWRAYACDVAAAYAVSLLRDGPVPLRAAVATSSPTAPSNPTPSSPSPAAPASAPVTQNTQVQGQGHVVGIGAIAGSGHQIHVTVNQGPGAATASREPAPVRTTPDPWPTTASLRMVLQQVLRIDSDLDAFCLDYFPAVKRLFSSGMDAESKRNLLLEKEDSARIWKFLQKAEPKACAKYAHMIELEG